MKSPELSTLHARKEDMPRMQGRAQLFQVNQNLAFAKLPWWRKAATVIVGLAHPWLGHHWTRLVEYDPGSDHLIETGHWICTVGDCPQARYG